MISGLNRYAAIVPVEADQAAVAIWCCDIATGRLWPELVEQGTLAPRWATPCWGDPPLLAQLERDLRACGMRVVRHHVLVPAEDACKRAALMAEAFAAWSWRVEHGLDPGPPQPGDSFH